MTRQERPAGGESALKERRRQRIVQAATQLLLERSGGRFTFEDVAERAELSRRTIFNYFPSTDDLVVGVVSQMISGIVETVQFDLQADGTPADAPEAIFEQVAGAMGREDTVAILTRLTGALGGLELADPRISGIVGAACLAVTDRLTEEIARRHPDVDRLGIDLLATHLIGGLPVLYRHWAAACGVVDTPASRRRWNELLDVHILAARDGYLAAARLLATPPAADGADPALRPALPAHHPDPDHPHPEGQ